MRKEGQLAVHLIIIFIATFFLTSLFVEQVSAVTSSCNINFENRCTSSNGFETCIFNSATGIGYWDGPGTCGSNICSLGACVPSTGCAVGQTVCLDHSSYKTCNAVSAGSNVGVYGNTITCPSNSMCILGHGEWGCVPIACNYNTDCNDNNACTGDYCINAGTPSAVCSHPPSINCPSGQVCNPSTITCVSVPPPCTNECNSYGATQCSTGGYQTCGYYDADACLDLSSVSACPSGQTCVGGGCSVSAVLTKLNIDFSAPTPASGAKTTSRFIPFNASISSSPQFESVNLSWQGGSYSLYDNSLLLSLSFDNDLNIGESATRAIDVSIYGKNGTLNSGTNYQKGKRGLGVRTDGAQEAVTFPSISLPSSYTIEAWTLFPLPTTFGSGYRALVHSSVSSELFVAVNSNGYLGVYKTTGFVSSGYNVNALAGWHHIVAVASGGRTEFYIDGNNVGNANAQVSAVLNRAGNGNLDGVNGNQWGTFDELRVWGRALSSGEIQFLLSGGVKKITGERWQAYSSVNAIPDGLYTYQMKVRGVKNNITDLRSIQVGYNSVEKSLPAYSTRIDFTGSDKSLISLPEQYKRRGSVVYSANGLENSSARFDRAVNTYLVFPSQTFSSYPKFGQSTSNYQTTFSIWFNTTKSGVILGQVTNNTEPRSLPYGWVPALYVDSSGRLRSSFFWHGSTFSQLVSSSPVNDGVWHQAIITYDNGLESLYVDGNLMGTQIAPMIGNNEEYSYIIGTGYTLGWPQTVLIRSALLGDFWMPYEGLIDEIKVYASALNKTQVADVYDIDKSLFYSLKPVSCSVTGCVSGESCVNNICVSAVSVSRQHFRYEEGYGANVLDSITKTTGGIYPVIQTSSNSWSTGIQGGAILFTGNQFQSMSQFTSDQLSISVWFNTTKKEGIIAGYQDALPSPYGSGSPSVSVPILYIDKNSKLRGQFWGVDNSQSTAFASSKTVTDNLWHHAVLTANASEQALYLDGVLVNRQVGNWKIRPISTIGGGHTSASSSFATGSGWKYLYGSLDELQIFNVSLNDAQVKALFNGEEYPQALTVTCSAQCVQEGAQQCSGTQVQTCGNYDSDSCLEWSTPVLCNLGYSCKSPANTCTPDSTLVNGLMYNYDFDSTSSQFIYNGFNWIYYLTPGKNGNGAKTEPRVYFQPGFFSSAGDYSISTWTLFPLPTNIWGTHTLVSGSSTSFSRHLMIDSQGYLGLMNSGIFYSSGYNINALAGWHQITVVSTNAKTDFYVDGILRGTVNQKVASQIYYMGNSYLVIDRTGGDFWGTFDEVKLWNRALASTEISQLYTS